MIFPNEICDIYWGIMKHIEELGVDRAIYEYGRGGISKEIIEKIQANELSKEYQEQQNSFLTETHYREIRENYRVKNEDITDVITHRFRMSADIKRIDDRIIKEDFCSIIIEGKNKKKIIKELSRLGIGVDFIYPELEYTAAEIKRLVE